jgi:bifunctional non-homologous end joining protein LigD
VTVRAADRGDTTDAHGAKEGTMQAESISLYFREGSSDKEYHAELQPSGDGFVVTFRYGRRGEALKSGMKTVAPVAYAAAKKAFDALVLEKTRKGYSPGAAGAAYQSTPLESRFAGYLPQLLNAVEQDEVDALLDDARWVMQEKYDGKRCLVRKSGDAVEGINRRGLVVALPAAVAEAAASLVGTFVIDAELVGCTVYAFDLLEQGGRDYRALAYADRYAALTALLASSANEAAVRQAECFGDKRAALARITAERGEGVVFKDWGAPYTAGRPASGGPQLKYKLVASATCRVAGGNGTKRSVALELLDASGRWTRVGSVTIPANQAVPDAGSLVEVQYLYAFRGGALFQPVYRGQRSDVTESSATLAQLKFKADAEPEDEAA